MSPKGGSEMVRIVTKRSLRESVVLMEFEAPLIAEKAKAGQFVILRVGEGGERIPLTVSLADRSRGTVTVVFQTVGGTTMSLASKEAGDTIADLVGPLGNPTDVSGVKRAAVVGGGVGCAIALPVAKALRSAGAEVTVIAGFRSEGFVILEDELCGAADRLILTTDDGSRGVRGNVCQPLRELLAGGGYDAVYAIGPLVMMKAVAEATRPFGVKTIASMNPIMIDGTGMCGCCRVTVGGEMKFACVDGPDFDAHLIDFDEAILRNRQYLAFEARKREAHCNLLRQGEDHG